MGVGTHAISASAEGYDPAKIEVAVAGGDRLVVKLVLTKHLVETASLPPVAAVVKTPSPRVSPVQSPTPAPPIAAEPARSPTRLGEPAPAPIPSAAFADVPVSLGVPAEPASPMATPASSQHPPAAVQSAPIPPGSPPPATRPGRRLRIAGLVCGVTATALVGAGVYFGLETRAYSNSAESASVYNSAYAARGRLDEKLQWSAFGVGAGLAVAGALLYAIGAASTSAPAVALVPLPAGVGLSANGTF
jgi:hypothetical protein